MLDEERMTKISKYLSKHLRHSPEALGLTLEPGGWVGVEALLAACAQRNFKVSHAELDEVVVRSPKQRFAFDASGERIRANQGHSVAVDLELPPSAPPALLYHGTAAASVAAILAGGILPMSRQQVHLSPDTATARAVGARHGRPVVLAVAAGRMYADGYQFFCAANGVWLTDAVPAAYIEVASPSA